MLKPEIEKACMPTLQFTQNIEGRVQIESVHSRFKLGKSSLAGVNRFLPNDKREKSLQATTAMQLARIFSNGPVLRSSLQRKPAELLGMLDGPHGATQINSR